MNNQHGNYSPIPPSRQRSVSRQNHVKLQRAVSWLPSSRSTPPPLRMYVSRQHLGRLAREVRQISRPSGATRAPAPPGRCLAFGCGLRFSSKPGAAGPHTRPFPALAGRLPPLLLPDPLEERSGGGGGGPAPGGGIWTHSGADGSSGGSGGQSRALEMIDGVPGSSSRAGSGGGGWPPGWPQGVGPVPVLRWEARLDRDRPREVSTNPKRPLPEGGAGAAASAGGRWTRIGHAVSSSASGGAISGW
eukprot:scaffold15978_cov103-Isochrysis_galbana.AAC.2